MGTTAADSPHKHVRVVGRFLQKPLESAFLPVNNSFDHFFARVCGGQLKLDDVHKLLQMHHTVRSPSRSAPTPPYQYMVTKVFSLHFYRSCIEGQSGGASIAGSIPENKKRKKKKDKKTVLPPARLELATSGIHRHACCSCEGTAICLIC